MSEYEKLRDLVQENLIDQFLNVMIKEATDKKKQEELIILRDILAGFIATADGEHQKALLEKIKNFAKKTTEEMEYNTLFDMTDSALEIIPVEETIEEPPANNKKARRGKTKQKMVDTSRLETRKVVHEPDTAVCPVCGDDLTLKEYKVQRVLEYIPAKYQIREDHYPVMECDSCTDDYGNNLVFKTEAEPELIEGSPATAELASCIAFMSYMAGVPLYRQEDLFKQKNLHLSRQTMTNWMQGIFDLYLEPLYNMMAEDFKGLDYVHLDESTHTVVCNRKKRGTNYELIGLSGRSEQKQMILYRYSYDRSERIVSMMIGDSFRGTIQTDGYQPYHKYAANHEGVKGIGCWLHVRNKMHDGIVTDPAYEKIKGLPPQKQLEAVKDRKVFYNFLLLYLKIQELLHEDQQMKEAGLSFEQVYERRQEKSRRLMEEIFILAESQEGKLPAKNKKSVALVYILNQREYLEAVFDDGRYEITNLPAERAVKKFVLWRKNSLFSFSENGAERMSGIMSILMSAKMNGLKPEEYLSWVLNEMRTKKLTDEDLRKLLPYSGQIPEELHINTSK
jgi:transposase